MNVPSGVFQFLSIVSIFRSESQNVVFSNQFLFLVDSVLTKICVFLEVVCFYVFFVFCVINNS